MTNPRTADTEQGLTLEQRRGFLKLPVEVRRRQMAEQADRMVQHYESPDQVCEREEWQGGDIVEFS